MNLSKLRRAAKRYEKDELAKYVLEPPGLGGMSPGQRKFHEDTSRRRLCIGGNQIGKSRILSYEILAHALGCHAFRETPQAPNVGWVMVADLRTGWANISSKIRELQPPGVLSDRCIYDRARGYRVAGSTAIEFKNGSLVRGVSGSQSLISLSGHTLDWLAIDEMPLQGHFSEARSRVAIGGVDGKGGPVFMAFTPIGRSGGSLWLRNALEGNPDTGDPPEETGWSIQRITLSPENCPHRDPDSIKNQIAAYGKFEYNQRVLGHWVGVDSSRWITSFGEDCIFNELPKGLEELGLGWDHGERPGSSVAYLCGWDGHRVYVLAEWTNKERVTPKEEAKQIKEMIESFGLSLYQIDRAVGDSNSAGRLGMGFSVNEILERQFAALINKPAPPFRIKVPRKGPGSVRARARIINAACASGSFLVHESCLNLISSLKHWRGEAHSEYKHAFDSCAYISETWLGTTDQGIGSMLIL